ncbi:MAG: arylamine N-acetyltransferase [Ruminococcaceae bacterium]|nr:arylamine N-acetyltransferase [Oscillospiraceae bacterium]MBQ2915247.1 arylamine N-acetyltransferase [Clostridia bacterium]
MFDFDIDRYLQRIGVTTEDREPTLEFLKEVHRSHYMAVPYENLDIIQGKPLDLSTEALYDKIVNCKRGGYCFEINGLFGALLRSLNYDVTDHLARFLLDEENIPMRRHRVLKVQLPDGAYACDVGIGVESPRIPLRIVENEVQNDGFADYKFENDPFLGWILWQKKMMAEWKKLYAFTDEVQLSVDFLQPSFYCEKSPDSVFNKDPMLALKTTVGLNSYDGKTFRVSSKGNIMRSIAPKDKADEQRLIAELFGLKNIVL